MQKFGPDLTEVVRRWTVSDIHREVTCDRSRPVADNDPLLRLKVFLRREV